MLKTPVISVVERMSQELEASVVLLLHSSGQILFHSGSMAEEELPPLAAVFAAMVSACQSLGQAQARRLSCEFEHASLYAVAVGEHHWLTTLYNPPLNPGLFRQKVRQYGRLLERLEPEFSLDPPSIEQKKAGIKVTTFAHGEQGTGVKATPGDLNNTGKTPLFENITDEEIDTLFTLGGGEA